MIRHRPQPGMRIKSYVSENRQRQGWDLGNRADSSLMLF